MKKVLFTTTAMALTLLGAGCAPNEKKSEPQPQEKNEAAAPAPSATSFVHPKFGFSFELPVGIVAIIATNGNDVSFVDGGNGAERAILVVQPGIPGIPLQDNKVEKIKVGGVAAHLYHDQDAADGGNVDRLIADFPDGKNTIRMSAPELPGQQMLDLKAVAKSWKWKK